MKLKIRATLLVLLSTVFVFLLFIPVKTEATVRIAAGNLGYSNGMYLCYCPSPENSCSCAWFFSDIEE